MIHARLILTIAAAWLAAPALAGLPAPIAEMRSTHGVYFTDYTYSTGAISSAFGSASVAVSPYPAVAASSIASYGYYASLQYYFTVSGAVDGVNVPMIAYATLYATASGNNAHATVGLSITSGNYGGIGDFSLYTDSQGFADPRTVSHYAPFRFNAETNATGRVWMTAQTDTQYGGTASAFVDPLIIIDPAFATLHPEYTLAFSAGIVNATPPSAVPEPAAWALFIAGFGLSGAALRRRAIPRAA